MDDSKLIAGVIVLLAWITGVYLLVVAEPGTAFLYERGMPLWLVVLGRFGGGVLFTLLLAAVVFRDD